MTKNDLVAKIAAILTTLAELNTGAPESTLYLACNMNLDHWSMIRAIMEKAGWIKVAHHYVRLTDAGKSKAQELETAFRK